MKDKVETNFIVTNIFRDRSSIPDPDKYNLELMTFIIMTTIKNKLEKEDDYYKE